MAAGSMHIGSGPGVAGLSGMQVKLLVPLGGRILVRPAARVQSLERPRAAPRRVKARSRRSKRASGVVPGTAGVLLLSGFDPELEAVLRRRQRAGREFVERARGVVGLV